MGPGKGLSIPKRYHVVSIRGLVVNDKNEIDVSGQQV